MMHRYLYLARQRICQNLKESSEFEQEEEGPDIPSMCSICHNEPPVNAVQLKCGHIFCFLCIKSASETTGACALCRTEIDLDFNFQEHRILGAVRLPQPSCDGCYWFYEGYRGWWLYDADTNRDIEEAFKQNVKKVEKFIAGYNYTIDLDNMTQQRKDGEGRSRKIRRATLDIDNILGMAGVKGSDIDEMLFIMRGAS